MVDAPQQLEAEAPTPAERSRLQVLKQRLIDFVYDAEGELATAFERFSAQQLSRWSKPNLAGLNRTELAVEMFLSEGSVGTHSVTDLFQQESSDLSAADKQLLEKWPKCFNGMFVVRSAAAGGYQLMNWLTDKTYAVWPTEEQGAELLARVSVNEIVMARLLPISETAWVFSGPLTLLGKLGKPKLAVAIGNFKKWFPYQLYGDAPELKEAAWESVKQQYEDFVELFGNKQVTMSGYELNKRFKIYQEKTSEAQMAKAGIDSNKSLKEIAQEAGISAEEVAEAVEELGEESAAAKTLLNSAKPAKMVMPKADLPDEFRNAEAVTVFVHPRWGQMLRKDYADFETAIAQASPPTTEPTNEPTNEPTTAPTNSSTTPEKASEKIDRFVKRYLDDEQVNAYVWHEIAKAHGNVLEPALQRVLAQPDFKIEQDLDEALIQRGKSLTPELPETASVPLHLHTLFQEALIAVGKAEKPKKNKKSKKKSGFGS